MNQISLKGRRFLAGASIVMLLGVSPAPAGAQYVSTSSINGTVVDGTGSVLPGVAVALTSPALQVGRMETATDAAGRYEFPVLPAGLYRITFELTGFQPFVRESLQLEVGFAARVDPVLRLGSQSDAVTVAGASPLIDVASTGGGQRFSGGLLNDEIPGARLNSELGRITPGLMGTAPPNIGLLGAAAGGGFTTYGESNFRMLVDGVNLLTGTFPDQVAAQEIDVRTFGNGPDISASGAVISVVTKSGGNDFHGRYEEQYQNDAMQSSNLDAALRAQQLTTLDSTRYYNDVNADLGGRIVQDKLWFYSAYHDRRNERTATGFVMHAGSHLTFDPTSPPFYPTVWSRQFTEKITAQATRRVQLIAYLGRDIQIANGNLGSVTPRFVPYESSTVSNNSPLTWTGEVRATLNDRILFNAQVGHVTYRTNYQDTPGNDTLVSRFNLATMEVSGGSISAQTSQAETKKIERRFMAQGNLTFVPQGISGHELKTGYRVWLQAASAGDEPDHPAGNYQLIYNTVNGVPYTPVEITTYNFPVTQLNRENAYSVYANDRWQIGTGLTLNLGLRYDGNHAWVPPQTKPQGQFGGSGSFPMIDSNRWRAPAPRLGAAWDVTGAGRTLVKMTYSRYNAEMADTFAAPFNQNGVVTDTYLWTDPTHCDCYVPATVDLNTNGRDFVGLSGSTNNIQNFDLKSPREHELTASIEHGLTHDMTVRAVYVYKRMVDDIATINVLRPYSAYDIALGKPVPAPDGTTAAGSPTITIYDFEPAYKGSAFIGNEMVNRPDAADDHYHTAEVTLDKRQTGHWSIVTSIAATKNHRWLTTGSGASLAVPQSPNDVYFPVDDTWNVVYKLTGRYQLPYQLQLGGVFDVQRGAPGQRTALFSTPQSGFVTGRLEPYGAERGPVRSEANLRVSRSLRLAKGRLQLELDALNVFNSNSVWTATYASGPSFGAVTLIQSPRVFRLGAAYEF
jgi:hypothetical protein